MTRRLLTLLLVLVVPLCVVGIPGYLLVSRERWARQRLLEGIAAYYAHNLNTEVRIGSLRGNLITGIELRDMAVAERGGTTQAPVLSARSVRLRYGVWSVIRGYQYPAEVLRSVEIRGLRGRVRRRADGRLDVADLVPPKPEVYRGRFSGVVRIRDAELAYEDLGVRVKGGGPLRLQLTHVRADVDLADPFVARYRLAASEGSGRARRIALAGRVRRDGRFTSAAGTIEGLDVPWLYRSFVASPKLAIRSGRADLHGRLMFVQNGAASYSAAVEVGECLVASPELPGEPIRVRARGSISPAGVRVSCISAQGLGAEVQAAGALFGWTGGMPSLDAVAMGMARDVGCLRALLKQHAPQLPDLGTLGGVQVQVAAVGEAATPTVRFRATLPGHTWVRLGTGTSSATKAFVASAAGLQADGLAYMASQPAVGATLSARRAFADNLDAVLPENQSVKSVRLEPLQDLRADVLWAEGRPILQGTAETAAVLVNDVPVRDLSIRYALVGSVLQVDPFSAAVGGGRVTGRALVDARQKQPQGYAEVDLAGVDARLATDLGLVHDTTVSGTVGGRVVAALRDGSTRVLARLEGQDLQYDGYELRTGRALASYDGHHIAIGLLEGLQQRGLLWAQGTMDPDGPLNVRFWAADVPANLVADQLPAPGAAAEEDEHPGVLERFRRAPRGLLWARGRLTGTTKEPHFAGEVLARNLGWTDLQLPFVAARVEGDEKQVALGDLLVQYGSAALTGQVTLAEVVWPKAGTGQGLDAAVSGHLALRGADVQTLLTTGQRLADRQPGSEDWRRLRGLVGGEADVGGRLSDPTASGTLAVTHGGYERYDLDDATAEFALADDTVDVPRVVAHAYGAELTASGVVADVYQSPQVDADFATSEIELSRLPIRDRVRPAGSVIASAGHLSVRNGQVAVSALVRSPEVRYAKNAVTGLRARVGYADDEVRVDELTAHWSGVTLRGEARLKDPGAGQDATVAATVTLDEPSVNLSDIEPLARYASDVSGALALRSVAVTGTLGRPVVRATVASSDLVVRGQHLDGLRGVFIASQDTGGVEGLYVEAAGGVVRGDALVSWPRLEGSVALDVTDLRLPAFLKSVAALVPPRLGRHPSPYGTTLPGVRDTLFSYAHRMDGREGPGVKVPTVRHAHLALQTTGPLQGAGSLSEVLKRVTGDVNAQVVNLRLGQRELPQNVDLIAKLLPEGKVNSVTLTGEFGGGEVWLDGSGQVDGPVHLSAHVTDVDVARLPDWLPRLYYPPGDPRVTYLPEAGGVLSGAVTVTGEEDNPRVEGWARLEGPVYQGQRIERIEVGPAHIADRRLTIPEKSPLLVEAGPGQAVRVWGELPLELRPTMRVPPDGALDLQARLDQVDVQPVRELAWGLYTALSPPRTAPRGARPAPVAATHAERLRVEGLASATLALRGTPRSPVASGELRLSQWRLAFGQTKAALGQQAHPVVLEPAAGKDLVMRFRPDREGGRPGTAVDLQDGLYAHLTRTSAEPAQAGLDLDVGIQAGEAVLAAFERRTPEGIGQRLGVEFRNVQAFVERGPIPLAPGLQLTDVQLGLLLQSDAEGRYELTVLPRGPYVAKLGHGLVQAEGGATLDAREIPLNRAGLAGFGLGDLLQGRWDLKVSFDGAEVQVPRLLAYGKLDGAVQLVTAAGPAGGGPDTALRGDLRLSDASLLLPISSGEGREYHGLSARLPAPKLDLRVALGHGCRLIGAPPPEWSEGGGQGILGRLALQPVALLLRRTHGDLVSGPDALVVTGTPQDPNVRLRLACEPDGASVRTYGPEVLFHTLTADVQLRRAPGALVPPYPLRLTATAKGEGTVTLRAPSGEDVPVGVTLDAELPLPESELLAAGGTEAPRGLRFDPQGAMTESEAFNLFFAQMLPVLPTQEVEVFRLVQGWAVSQVTAQIEERLRRGLDLDQLQLNLGANQRMDLRVGKYLVKDLLVSYRQAIGAAEFDFDVSYRLPQSYQLRYHTDETGRNEVRLEYSRPISLPRF